MILLQQCCEKVKSDIVLVHFPRNDWSFVYNNLTKAPCDVRMMNVTFRKHVNTHNFSSLVLNHLHI